MKIKIGVLGTADIAERRMIPAIKKIADFEYVGVATANRQEWNNDATFEEANKLNKDRADLFVQKFSGKCYSSFSDLLDDDSINVVYIPLPPALHYRWIIEALNKGKNVVSEKPITCSYEETKNIIDLANEKNLCVIENYGFVYHNQIIKLMELLENKEIGDMRLVRANFGFPHRDSNDFRYNKKLGGGALLDCGGYTVKAASLLLGKDIKLSSSSLVVTQNHEVDMYGSCMFTNGKGDIAEVSFGMDNEYRCELSLWGSEGSLILNRAFTAPDSLETKLTVKKGNECSEIIIPADDQFMKVLLKFRECLDDENISKCIKEEILIQSRLIDEISKNEIVIKKEK